MFTVIISSYFITLSLCSLNPVIEIFLIYTVLAVKSLACEADKIFNLLASGNIIEARRALSYIVSRDTANMDERNIIRSTVETVSENIVDGITAPLFYLIIGGAPLAMAYKAASTLDSMVGYKNEKYIDFGYASAKMDDILNFIPARITGFILIPLAALLTGKNFIRSFKIVLRDRHKHESPNSAHPEAAASGALGLQFGGLTVYNGKAEQNPLIGDKIKDFELNDIKSAVRILYLTAVIAVIFGLLIRYYIQNFF